MKNRTIDLLADVGESFGAYSIGDDDTLLDVLTSANVACGFHAGDPRVMDHTVRTCVQKNVSVGAHPGFPDLVGFGRRTMELSYDEIRTDVMYQIGALSAFTRARGARIAHLTTHGRLGNMAQVRPEYANAVADAVQSVDRTIIVVARGGALVSAAEERGLMVKRHVLADRAYRSNGTLVSRREPGAVITDTHELIDRVLRMVEDQEVLSVEGDTIEIPCDTVLVHGDTPGATKMAVRVRGALEEAGVVIRSMAAADDATGLASNS